MKEAMFYEKLDNKKVKCNLCPNNCKINVDNTGICRVRKNIDGKLYALSYGKISGYALDPIEKKPINNYKPGSYIFSIGSYGCNLKCKFCQNYQIAHGNPQTLFFTPEETIEKAKKYNQSIGLAYTYNEPIINYEYILECAKLAKKEGLDNILVSNGFINKEPFIKLLEYIDAANIDLKAFNTKFYEEICASNLEDVKNSIILAAKYTHLEITTLLIDNLNTKPNEIEKLAKWISNIDKNIPLHLSRYFPCYKMNRPQTKISTMFESYAIAKKYLNNVYLGNV